MVGKNVQRRSTCETLPVTKDTIQVATVVKAQNCAGHARDGGIYMTVIVKGAKLLNPQQSDYEGRSCDVIAKSEETIERRTLPMLAITAICFRCRVQSELEPRRRPREIEGRFNATNSPSKNM